MKAEAIVESYLEEARTWDLDRREQAAKSVRRAWMVTGVSLAVTVLAVGAVVGLTPLKRVDPFVIRVDNTTGVVDVVPTYRGEGSVSELVTRQLLTTYITARERYALAVAEADYETVGAFQSAALNAAWVGLWDRANPDSPLNIYRDGTTARVQLQAITFLKRAGGVDDLAQVRFIRGIRPGGNGQEQLTHYIATIQYGYGTPSHDDHTRALNPLGFRILEYRREAEVAADAPAAGSTP